MEYSAHFSHAVSQRIDPSCRIDTAFASGHVQALDSAAWPKMVGLWASYNRYLAHVIRHLPDAKLEVVCRIGSNAPVSLRYLAEDYVVHLVHHLDQIGVATCS